MDFLNDEKLSNEEKLRRYFLESGKLPFADRDAAEKAADEQKSGMGIGSALAGLGATMAGRAPSTAMDYFDKRKEAIDASTVGAFDKASKEQSDRVAEYLKNKYAMDLRQQERKEDRSFEMQKERARQGVEMQKEMAKQKLDQLSKQDPAKLSGTDKARFDNALMVLKNIDKMGGALDQGENTFSLVGDTPYTAAERMAAEAYGRMQSGGAISEDEEKRFMAMLPKATDSAEMQRKKLLDQKEEMISRLKTLGFTPEQAGYQPKQFDYGKKEVRRQRNKDTGEIKVTYDDGTTKIIGGK